MYVYFSSGVLILCLQVQTDQTNPNTPRPIRESLDDCGWMLKCFSNSGWPNLIVVRTLLRRQHMALHDYNNIEY